MPEIAEERARPRLAGQASEEGPAGHGRRHRDPPEEIASTCRTVGLGAEQALELSRCPADARLPELRGTAGLPSEPQPLADVGGVEHAERGRDYERGRAVETRAAAGVIGSPEVVDATQFGVLLVSLGGEVHGRGERLDQSAKSADGMRRHAAG